MSDRGRTLVEKVVGRAAGKPDARAGDFVFAAIDLAYGHEGSGPRRWQPILDELNRDVFDPHKIAIVIDHYVPATSVKSAEIMQTARVFAKRHGVEKFFDAVGISHVVLAQHGLLRPGAVIAGGDSHSTMGGAFGAYAAGYGMTDMGAMVATGETWIRIPETIRVEWAGRLGPGLTAKDMMLFLCRELGMDNAFTAVEFAGDTIAAMTMPERMVLCNMATELGCEAGVVAPDRVTFDYLAATGNPVADEAATLALASDEDAVFKAVHRFDACALTPQVAAPHSPANSAPASEFGDVTIDQAYIGACVGAKLDDLHRAAEILKGRKVADGVRLLIAPASSDITTAAAGDGTLGILLEAGAKLLPSGCGACAGLGAGVIGKGETCISSTNRNFKGRMGSTEANVYLGSAYAVAAAAIAGRIVDPREMLLETADA